MGNAFSGPTAFEWLNFTPQATAVLQKTPFFLATLFIVLISLGIMIGLAFFISRQTGKPYAKPKVAGNTKKAGWGVQALRAKLRS